MRVLLSANIAFLFVIPGCSTPQDSCGEGSCADSFGSIADSGCDSGDDADWMDFADTDIAKPDIAPDGTDADVSGGNQGSIRGRVVREGLTDSSGLNVILFEASTLVGVDTVVTSADGRFEFSSLPNGDYRINLPDTEFGIGDDLWISASVIDQGVTDLGDRVVRPAGVVTGVVTLGGANVGNSYISVFTPGRTIAVSTDDSGNFRMGNMPVEPVTICAGAQGYVARCFEPVDVVALGTVDIGQIDIQTITDQSPSTSNVHGTVTLIGRTDSSGINVRVDGTGIATNTDKTGAFQLADVPAGIHDIVFDAPGGSGFERGVVVHDYSFFAGLDDVISPMQIGLGDVVLEYASDVQPDIGFLHDPGLAWVHLGKNGPLHVHDFLAGTTTLIADRVSQFVFSPDSSTVAFTDPDSKGILFAADVHGGNLRELASVVGNVYPEKFTDDSMTVLFIEGVSDGELDTAQPGIPKSVSTDGGQVLDLFPEHDCLNLTTTPDGRYQFCIGSDFVEATGTVNGSDVMSMGVTRMAHVSAIDGSSLVVICVPQGAVWAWDATTESARSLNCIPESCHDSAVLLPSGDRVLLRTGAGSLTVLPLAVGDAVRIDAPGRITGFGATTDSSRIVFTSTSDAGITTVYVVSASGGNPTAVYEGMGAQVGFTLLHDPSEIVVQDLSARTNPDSDGISPIYRVSLDGSSCTRILEQGHSTDGGTWTVVEGNSGYVYTLDRNLDVSVYDLTASSLTSIDIIYRSDTEPIPALDLSGFMGVTADNGFLTWVSFDGEVRLPIACDMTFMNPADRQWLVSPDSRYAIYASYFGAKSNGIVLDGNTRRLLAVPLP